MNFIVLLLPINISAIDSRALLNPVRARKLVHIVSRGLADTSKSQWLGRAFRRQYPAAHTKVLETIM